MKESILFKEWLPDQPELGSQGLVRAENVFPSDGAYEALPTATVGATVGAVPLGGISFPIGTPLAYGALIGTSSLLLRLSTAATFATVGSGYASTRDRSGTEFREFPRHLVREKKSRRVH